MATLDDVERLLDLAKDRVPLDPTSVYSMFETYDCPKCDKTFNTLIGIQSHKQLHDRYGI